MNPNSKKPGHLFFTPRTPWGTRAGQQSFRQHQRASEDERALPEEDKDGHISGKIESSGETHGKPETTIDVGYNTNSTHRETARQSDPLWDTRKEYDPHMAELDRQRAREKKERAKQAKNAAQAAQQPRLP